MFLQKEKPGKGDVWFNNSKAGGISTCINGNPVDAGCNVLANCVGGAAGAYNKAACADQSKPKWGPLLFPPNAGGILDYAKEIGLPTSQNAAPGALIIWKKGALTKENKQGHVAFVYKVDDDGTIYTSESEWGGRAWVNRTYKKTNNYFYANNYTFIGFVLQPGTKEETKVDTTKETVPSGIIKKGDHGDAVKWLQTKLCAKGYLRKSEIDGDFGKITLGALLAFQLENGLIGVCGDETKAKL